MSYAILRAEKRKDLRGIGIHIDRSNGGEISVPENAEIDSVNSNIHWYKNGSGNLTSYSQKEWTEYTSENTLTKRVNSEINERYNGDRKIRKDAVKCIEFIMTSDHEKMSEIFSDRDTARDWISENKKFLEDTYGKENLLQVSLHLDEKTPHIHALVSCLTNDGRLSGKEVFGNKTKLRTIQDDYALRMERFGMKRGQKNSGAKHTRPRELNNHSFNITR